MLTIKKKRIAIIGAGLRGLASAAYLKQAGYEVSVFERESSFGGIWRKTYPDSTINTPRYGYTFHPSNRWRNKIPQTADILDNLTTLVRDELLKPHIRYNTEVNSVIKTPEGLWKLNTGTDEYHGLLICTGFLGLPIKPPHELIKSYRGTISSPYERPLDRFEGKNVAIIGSGATALEMLGHVVRHNCASALLVVRAGTTLRDCNWFEDLKFWIACNPWIYQWTKRSNDSPHSTAVSRGLSELLSTSTTTLVEGNIQSAIDRTLHLDGNRSFPADEIVWCTGWDNPTPDWVSSYRCHPSFMAGMCPHCTDAKGLGHGSSTIYAKVLDCILRYQLTQPFIPDIYGCECQTRPENTGPHIVKSAIAYLYNQPGGRQIIIAMFNQGFRKNVQRLSKRNEPLWASLLSFVHAPLGL